MCVISFKFTLLLFEQFIIPSFSSLTSVSYHGAYRWRNHHFFDANNHMYIPNKTVVQILNEGIYEMKKLLEFKNDAPHEISENFFRTGGRVPDPNYIVLVQLPVPPPPVPTILNPPFISGVKSQKHFLIECDMIRLYETIWRNATTSNIQWVFIMRKFGENTSPEPTVEKRSMLIRLISPMPYQSSSGPNNSGTMFATILVWGIYLKPMLLWIIWMFQMTSMCLILDKLVIHNSIPLKDTLSIEPPIQMGYSGTTVRIFITS